MKLKKKAFTALFGILVIIFIAGSCKQSVDSSGKKPILSNKTDLQVFKFNAEDLLPIPTDNKIAKVIGNAVETAVLTIKPANEKATVKVKLAGTAVPTDSADKTKYNLSNLVKGDNVVTVQVTAENGTKGNLITLTIHRTKDEEDVSIDGLPNGVFLKNLKTIDGDISGWAYNAGTKTFSADIAPHEKEGAIVVIKTANTKAKVKMTSPTATANRTLFFDLGQNEDYLYWSCYIELVELKNEIKVDVTAEDGVTTETYTIELYRDTEIGLNKDTTLSISIDDEPVNVLPDASDVYNVFLPVPAPASITLDVAANSPFTIVGINKPVANNTDSATITIGTDKVTEVTVNSKAKDGTEKAYKVKLTKQASDCYLKNISITESPRFKFEALKTIYDDIAVNYGDVHISATANDSSATIAIDGKNPSDPDYGKVAISASKLGIDIVVTNGSDSKTYTLNFVEAATTVDVDVLVVDSIGGTKVDGTVLKVFEAGTTTQVGSNYNVANGLVSVTGLTPNKAYDFKLIGQEQKWAGSLVQNYYINATKKQNLTMIQFVHGDHTRGIEPPKITSIYPVIPSAPLKDGDKLDASIISLYAKFESKVGSIEPVAWHGFGAKLGVGTAPNFQNGIQGSVWGTPTETGGTFTTEYNFRLDGNIILPKGKTDLIIVGYDQANNRVEKHLYIEFDNTTVGKTLEQAKFKNMFMIVQRLPYSAGLYSTDPDYQMERSMGKNRHEAGIMALDPTPDGRRTSYKSVVLFNFEQNGVQEPIIGFDIYRREKGIADFKKVSQTLYATAKTETGSGWGTHQGFDTDLGLEENKEYEYKIVAFNETHSKESPVMTVKILESFTYELVGPAKNEVVSLAAAEAMSYTCTISNTNLLKKESADLINAGLLIADHQGIMKFGARFNYIFDAKDKAGNYTGKPDLAIFTKLSDGRLSVNELLAFDAAQADPAKKILAPYGVTQLDDLITLDSSTGILTLTAKFVQIPFFNTIGDGGVSMKYEKGVAYQWDIQDWGKNEYNLNDDFPMRIIKTYDYINDDGEKDYIECQAYGNDRNAGANAINGRFSFTIEN